MPPLIWEHRPDGLRSPVLVCAFKGWNDAGDAASGALLFATRTLGATRFAHVDPQEFYDFQSTRPQIRLTEGRVREIDWPGVELAEARIPGAASDLVLLCGQEPSLRWPDFARLIVELAEVLGVRLVVSLGALLADVPHTAPVHVTALSSDEALTERLGLSRASYAGPTGIVGVLHGAFVDAGVTCASLWASVPHYVAAAPNPKASLALVRRLEGIAEIAIDATELEREAAEFDRQLALAVQENPEVRAFVEQLEQLAEDEEDSEEPEPQPDGEAIAREFQRFLRQREA